MKTLVKQTKRRTFIKLNDEIFSTNNNWDDKSFEKIGPDSLNNTQKEALDSSYGWVEINNCEDLQDAYYKFIGILIQAKEDRKKENINAEIEETTRWEALSSLDVIPATIENISLVLKHLNKQNWGAWTLPKMSIGYSAHQYDCDGKIATTIKLDRSVDGDTMFKVGGKRGHLNKYRSI